MDEEIFSDINVVINNLVHHCEFSSDSSLL